MEFTKSISVKLELTPEEVEALRYILKRGEKEFKNKLNPMDEDDWAFIEDLIQVLN